MNQQNELLQNKDTKLFLKQLVVEYQEELEKLNSMWKIKNKDDWDQIYKKFLEADMVFVAYEIFENRKRAKFLEKAIKRIYFKLQLAEGKLKANNARDEWEKKYNHAKFEVMINDVIRTLLNPPSMRGNISCPFHEDKQPSFHVYKNSNTFYCFSCNECGSPIDFIMKYNQCDFKQAIEILSSF